MEEDWFKEEDPREVFLKRYPQAKWMDDEQPQVDQVVTLYGDNWSLSNVRYCGNHIWRDANDGHEIDFDVPIGWSAPPTEEKGA